MTFDSREKSTYQGQPVECFRFSQGSTLWLWTSADKSITLPVGTFAPEVIKCGELDEERDDATLEVTVARDNPVAQLFIQSLPVSPVGLTVYKAHRGEESDYKTRLVGGRVTSLRFEGAEAVLTCAPLSGALRRRLPLIQFQSLCPWPLYGPGCTVSKAAFKDSILLTSVSTVTLVSSNFASRPDGWFNNGWVEGTNGATMFIVNHVGNTVTLMAPLAGLASGQTVFAYAGCDRTEATCNGKFNNLVNHLGFARIPVRNPYEGSIA